MSDITGISGASNLLATSTASSSTTGQQTTTTDTSSQTSSSSAAYTLSGNLPSLMQLANEDTIDTQLLQSLSLGSDSSLYNSLVSYNFYNTLNPNEFQALESVAKGQVPSTASSSTTTTTAQSTTNQTQSATAGTSSATSTGSNIDTSV